MAKIRAALVYNDEQLSVYVYNVFDEQIYIISKQKLDSIDIRQIVSDDDIEKYAELLNDKLGEIEDEISERIRTLDIVIDPNAFSFETKSFSVDFPESHTLVASDIKQIHDKAMRFDTAKQGYVIANFTTTEYLVDGVQKRNPVGSKGRQITLNGEIVYIDSETIVPLEQIIKESRYNQEDILVSSHLLKFAPKFANKQAIIEFGLDRMKFLTKTDDLVQNFAMEFGFANIFEKVYFELMQEHEASDSEAIVRHLQKHFKLADLRFDYEICDGVTYNQVAKLFRSIASEYVQGILLQILKQDIEIKKIYCITNEYSNEEWATFLRSFLEIEVVEYSAPAVNSHFNQELKVCNALAMNEKIRMKG